VGGLEHVIVMEIDPLYLASLKGPLDIMSECGNLQGFIGVRFEPQ
jgi:hypothetical protein